MLDPINSENAQVAQVAAALADAVEHGGLSVPYYRGATDALECIDQRIVTAEDALRFVTQAVHQAYHDGPIEQCSRNTCDHAMRVLGRR